MICFQVRYFRWLLAGSLAVLMFSCSGTAAGFPRWVVDDVGHRIYLAQQPQRIVSLAPANTELLFAVGAGSRVVGVTDYCDYPSAATEITSVGEYVNPSIELIVSLRADLVLAAYGNRKETVERLRALGHTVASLHPRTLDEVLLDVTLVSSLTGQDDEGRALFNSLQTRVAEARKKSRQLAGPSPSVWYVVWYPELWTAGEGTFADDLLQAIDARNIAGDVDGWKILSKERVILEDPEVIICSAMETNPEFLQRSILADRQLADLAAVRAGRIHVVNQDLVERPGPRIVKGLEELFRLVYGGRPRRGE